MIPVSTILQVHAYYDALGFSFLYEPLIPGGEPQRKTFLYLRDGNGHIAGSIFSDAEKVAEVMA